MHTWVTARTTHALYGLVAWAHRARRDLWASLSRQDVGVELLRRVPSLGIRIIYIYKGTFYTTSVFIK